MKSPFTFTPGKAGDAYIDMHYAQEIIDNFSDGDSEKFVYKILGLRGSGKSVVYSKVISSLKKEKKWLVYTLSSGGEPLQTLIGLLSKESFISSYEKSVTVAAEGSVEGGAKLIKGSGSISTEIGYTYNPHFYSDEATVKDMISIASKKGYRILIGIDDIAKTKEMTRFLSIIGDMILDEEKNVYLLCTGLTKNIEDFAGEPHLSFFVRSDKVETSRLSLSQISFKYQTLLGLSEEKAQKLALSTEGYAYAYQVIGELCYKRKVLDFESIAKEFDAIIADQYDIIWHTLTDAEKEFARIIVNTPKGKSEDIKATMTNKNSYGVLRGRLMKKHLVNTDGRGNISINLPRIKEYVNTWGTIDR